MTSPQIIWATAAYAIAFLITVYLTRAGPRRVVGAWLGAGLAALIPIEVIALGEVMRWWHWQFKFASNGCFPILLYVCFAVSGAPIYLITWRVGRRFGWRGLMVVYWGTAFIGPLRDYLIARHFPEWGGFASGAAPALAVAITYIVFLLVGHAAMRLIAGPAGSDCLARPACN